MQLQGLLRRKETEVEKDEPLENSKNELQKSITMNEKSSFQRNDFQEGIMSSFRQLSNKTNFQNVTLVSDDQVQMSENEAEKTFEMVGNTDLFGTSYVKPISINSDQTQGTATVGLDEHIQKQIAKVQGGHQCLICRKVSRNISHLKEHIEAHIEGLIFPCNYCESVSRLPLKQIPFADF